jgi:hypothetical protein
VISRVRVNTHLNKGVSFASSSASDTVGARYCLKAGVDKFPGFGLIFGVYIYYMTDLLTSDMLEKRFIYYYY